MTKGTETTSITTLKTELPRNLGRAGLTAYPGGSDRPLQTTTAATGFLISPCWILMHKALSLRQWHARLRHTIRRVVPVLVPPLLSHSHLSLSLIAKLSLVTILSTKLAMEKDWFGLRLGERLSTWFLTRLFTCLIARFFSRLVCLGCKLVFGCVLWWN
jgi:hypothetical protein